MFEQLIPIIAPVLLCALLGYGWAKSGLPFEREFLTRIIMNIGAPCLILNGIANLEFEPADFVIILASAITVLGICTVVGGAALRIAGQPLRSFLPPVVFGNTGNLGLPLCYFAFGNEGLGLAVAVYLIYSVSQFVFGPLFQGREPAWRTLVTTPMIYTALIGIGLLATDTPLPKPLANTVELLAGLAIPLMLLALGYSLASFQITRPGKAVGIAILRLLLGSLVGIGVAELFGLEGTMRGVIIIESAMPLAVFNFLLAARYDRHPEDVAGAIVISTLISFATMPLLILYALGEIGG
ncbi:MAG: AEC family transporter [Gammaproteobacteria bacterium]|nr:transporter [Chromatiales bacterium]MDP6675753.1 AEC family transporter [Gammaproteobacteria bacterium]